MANATQQEVDSVLSAYENAKEALVYANTIVVEPQLNSGNDYTMVWSTLYQQ